MRPAFLTVVCFFLGAVSAAAQTYALPRTLVSEELFHAVAAEYSGEAATKNVRGITRFHRIQASPGFTQAREWVVNRLQEHGVTDIEVETFPSDGSRRYQTYVSPMAWTVREGELWVEEPFRELFCRYTEVPMCLTTLSNGGEWRGEVVHVGAGTETADYEGKDVKGKIVLATGYAAQVHRAAVIERGALGVLIYLPADDLPEHPDIVRYNGLWPKKEEKDRVGFGFQLSRRQAERLLAALDNRQTVRVRAQVDAELHPGQLEVASAFFRGTELPDQEIILVAHLDHPKWSANDNASGSGALVEIARTLKKLTDEGKVSLRRTIRLMWVAEHFATIAWLDKHRDIGQRAIAVLNLDMVGEDLYKTNSRLRITRTPDSLPSFLNDLVENVAAQVAAADLTDPAGSKNLFHYQMVPYDPGSDHDMFNDATVGVPAMMLSHYPEWTHHTTEDTVDKVDPTTLKRIGVLATAAALWLAAADANEALQAAVLTSDNTVSRALALGWEVPVSVPVQEMESPPPVVEKLDVDGLRPIRQRVLTRKARLEQAEKAIRSAGVLSRDVQHQVLGRVLAQLRERFSDLMKLGERASEMERNESLIPRRLFIGPLADSYASTWFREQLGADYAWWREQAETIPHWEILVYETLNFTDGQRTLIEIEDAVEAEFGEVPDGVVEHILRDLKKVGLMEFSARAQN